MATATASRRTTGVAQELERALRPFLRPFTGGDLPVRLRAWDGSETGAGPLVELHSPQAITRLLWNPGELGAAQAYVAGEIDVPGDLDAALTHVRSEVSARGLTGARPGPASFARAARTALRLGALRGRPPAPDSQARVRGRLHGRERDRAAISHHYDFSNEFYSAVLDDHMAYSSAYWTSPEMTLEEAQAAKLDLVCRKLGLGPEKTLLDVGCGWGSLSLHAAEQFGARVLGITIAEEQKRFIDARIAERGLGDRVEIRLCDYRDVGSISTVRYDAAASIEMGEHVGQANYPTFVEVLHDAVRPGGRVLVQQMSRGGTGGGRHPGGGPFIEAFIAPDMTMRPVGETVDLLEAGGLEVRDVHGLREHYVRTVDAWIERFEAAEPRLRTLVPEEYLRVWRLYLVGGRMAFRDGRMGVDQILAVRPGAPHDLPAVRSW